MSTVTGGRSSSWRCARRVACLSVLLLSAACGPPPAAPPAPPQVTVATPLRHTITEWDEFTARLVAAQSVDVRARVDGYLETVDFTEGAMVRENERLAVIDRRPYAAVLARARAEVDAAAARLALARNEEARAEQVARRQLISAQELDNRRQRRAEAEAQLAAARAWVEAAQIDFDDCEIRAPISGRIGRRLVTRGNLVSGGENDATLLTTIVALDPIHAYITGDEQAYLRYLRLARAGVRPSAREVRTPALLRLADEQDWPHEGWVDFVDNQIDASSGTIQGRALFPNPDGVLTPGLFATMRIRGAGPYEALLVPDEAIAADQARRIVYVLDDKGIPVARGITPGRLVGTLREVSTGLSADDRVLINGIARVRPGLPVTVVEGVIEPPVDDAGIANFD